MEKHLTEQILAVREGCDGARTIGPFGLLLSSRLFWNGRTRFKFETDNCQLKIQSELVWFGKDGQRSLLFCNSTLAFRYWEIIKHLSIHPHYKVQTSKLFTSIEATSNRHRVSIRVGCCGRVCPFAISISWVCSVIPDSIVPSRSTTIS